MRVKPSVWSSLVSLFFGGIASTLVSFHASAADFEGTRQVLSGQTVHLRSGSEPEWREFERHTPDSASLVLRFQSHRNNRDATLLIAQDDVKLNWPVLVNERRVGYLFLMEAPLLQVLTVPAGLLQDGENTLTIAAPEVNDDILIGPVALDLRPSSEVLDEAALDIKVTDIESASPLPCRLTIVDLAGRMTPLSAKPHQHIALRPGVVYTPDGEAHVGLPAGEYTIYATRGVEYGLARQHVRVAAGERTTLQLHLRRELSTEGWICSDTHIHTGTYARHGDATVEERAVTLAGEGIELPISTEHDCLVDLSGAIARTEVQNWMTPVVGDEVTTSKGHFNVFPVSLTAPLPDKQITNWPKLIASFRTTPGVQVVVLNHPRNIHNAFQPFAATNFNAVTGENLRGFEFDFDAIEVANSSALQSDWMASFQDWFALLNHGYRFTSVGSSDGHDVSRYIVGQGRTYIRCRDQSLGHIDVSEACRNLRAGRATVSLGLWADLRVEDKFGPGDLATNLTDSIRVRVFVQGPSWVRADRVELFADGLRIREERVQASESDGPVNVQVQWEVPRPRHDVHLIALATGPGVTAPYWAIARPYQPSSPIWKPRVMGATNPIWVDADGDGKFTSARGYAQRLWRTAGSDFSKLLASLSSYDEAVAAQAASLCSAANVDLGSPAAAQALAHASEVTQRGFTAFRQAQAAGARPQ